MKPTFASLFFVLYMHLAFGQVSSLVDKAWSLLHFIDTNGALHLPPPEKVGDAVKFWGPVAGSTINRLVYSDGCNGIRCDCTISEDSVFLSNCWQTLMGCELEPISTILLRKFQPAAAYFVSGYTLQLVNHKKEKLFFLRSCVFKPDAFIRKHYKSKLVAVEGHPAGDFDLPCDLLRDNLISTFTINGDRHRLDTMFLEKDQVKFWHHKRMDLITEERELEFRIVDKQRGLLANRIRLSLQTDTNRATILKLEADKALFRKIVLKHQGGHRWKFPPKYYYGNYERAMVTASKNLYVKDRHIGRSLYDKDTTATITYLRSVRINDKVYPDVHVFHFSAYAPDEYISADLVGKLFKEIYFARGKGIVKMVLWNGDRFEILHSNYPNFDQ